MPMLYVIYIKYVYIRCMTLQYMTVGKEWVDINETQCNVKHLYCDSLTYVFMGDLGNQSWPSILILKLLQNIFNIVLYEIINSPLRVILFAFSFPNILLSSRIEYNKKMKSQINRRGKRLLFNKWSYYLLFKVLDGDYYLINGLFNKEII